MTTVKKAPWVSLGAFFIACIYALLPALPAAADCALGAADVRPGDGGFVLLRGTVRSAERNRYLWLELDGPVALRLPLTGDSGQLNRRDWQGA